MGLVSVLFRLARLSADVKAVTSGNPKRAGRRAKNKLVGRLLVERASGAGCGSRGERRQIK